MSNAVFIETYFAENYKFSVDDIPDLTGKVIIVTGGNTSVGKEIAKALLVKNAKVHIATRSEDKAKAAIEDLKQTTGKEAVWQKWISPRCAAEKFLGKEPELHVLFNNACVCSLTVGVGSNRF